MKTRLSLILGILLVFIFGMFFVSSQRVAFTNSVNNVQYSDPTISGIYGSTGSPFWTEGFGKFDDSMCETGDNFVLMIPPMGCQPMTVRSDLLSQQNVQVMCSLASVRINPLIKVSSIRSIGFTGQMPSEVAGVSFYPARAGIRSYNTLMGDPIYNNVGHVVITLKKNPNEASMPKFVEGNLTARISYDAERAFGVGNAIMYLESEDSSLTGHISTQDRATFWGGLGSIKLLSSDSERAKFGVYNNDGRLVREVILKEGETSSRIYLPGFYCQASFRLKMSDFTVPENSALLNIDGEEIWVREGSKILNGRCTVNDLNLYTGDTGKVVLSCSGAGRIELSLLGGFYANISLGNNEEKYSVGDFVLKGNVSKGSELNWYVGYSGLVGSGEDSNREKLLILVGSPQEVRPEVYSNIAQEVKKIQDREQNKNVVFNAIQSGIGVSGFTRGTNLLVIGEKNETLFSSGSSTKKLTFNGVIETRLVKEQENGEGVVNIDSEIRGYLDNADKAVKELLNDYPQVRGDLNRFGEIALLEQINLVSEIQDTSKMIALMETFLAKYPDSVYAGLVDSMIYQEKSYNSKQARSVFEINGQTYTINLRDFQPVNQDSKRASIWAGSNFLGGMKEGDEANITSNSDTEKLKVTKIHSNRVEADVLVKQSNGNYTIATRLTLRLNENLERKINDKNLIFRLSDLNVQTVARVEVLTEANNKQSEANFTYKIGIEQRTIQLNPNKSSEKARKLNETIKKLEDRNEKLGKVIEGWKGACLVTGLGLNLKNLITGSSGEAMARQEVMRSWKAFCESDRTPGAFGTQRSLDACYNQYAPEIKKDVEAYANAIKTINAEIGGEKNITKFVQTKLGTGNIVDIDSSGASVPVSSIRTWEQVRAHMLYEILKSPGVSPHLLKEVKTKRDSQLYPLIAVQAEDKALEADATRGISFREDPSVVETRTTVVWRGEYLNKLSPERHKNNISSIIGSVNPAIAGERIGTDQRFVLVLESVPTAGGIPVKVSHVFNVTNNNGDAVNLTVGEVYNKFKSYVYSVGDCDNIIRVPTITFYESGAVKGLAAMVPIDIKKGWYVRISSSVGGIVSEESRGYTSAAVPETFSLCNVGSNNNQEISDICTSVNVNQRIDERSFPIIIAGCSLDRNQYDILVRDAQRAIQKANQEYSGTGPIRISIPGRESFNARRGTPQAQGGPVEQCQDFMSPGECQILFNVCDPVICPPSRCDFGGKYPVSNVIQSGIVGSLMLCLPNFKPLGGDVYVPVCLTGVHEGLNFYISILKAQRDCLEQNAKDGSYVGTCDYMTKMYKCNLFWNAIGPYATNLFPQLFSVLSTGKRERTGGGEYLTFQTAWDNMESSLNFFQNTYGMSARAGLDLGGVEQFGVEFCDAFVGTSFPTTSKGLSKMLQPESPYQIYGEFHEVSHTDATVPPTSQYNVLVHIYAGKDQSVSYSAYLKNPPTSSYYASHPRIQVPRAGTGFVASGGQVTVSESFTAPAGYKELCVNINGRERCNFGPVSTSFAINQISDSYIERQAQANVTTQKECQQGSAGVVGFTSINPQAALTNVVDPRIDLQGIVRICSSENPGKGTSNEITWREVGYCGDRNIGCWLDVRSVQDSTGSLFEVAGSVTRTERAMNLLNEGATMNEPQSIAKIVEIKNSVAGLTSYSTGDIKLILNNITELEDKGYSMRYQVEGIYWRFKLYEQIVRKRFNFQSSVEPIRLRVEPAVETKGSTSESKETLKDLGQGDKVSYKRENFVVRDKPRLVGDNIAITLLRESGSQATELIQGSPSDTLEKHGLSLVS